VPEKKLEEELKPPKTNLGDEFRYDVHFVSSHTLQPGWYKIAKVFILIGFLVGYALLFGVNKTLIFLGTFFVLAAALHILYRVKTEKFTQTWMDFVVIHESGEMKMKRIGIFYYSCILLFAIAAVVVSQVLG
jgi:hypothetical protein